MVATASETADTRKPESAVVQPPLPPNPPPDEPPPIVLKKEIEDEYRNDTDQSKFTRDESNKTENTPKAMCRDFIRGSCIKGESCIYLHKLIISQLEGVYTFCRDFQNKKGCKMPNGKICKFVHANVFEKENFFKTGYLPPHTMSHFKDINISQPASQLPPEGSKLTSSTFSRPLPVPQPGVTPMLVGYGAQTCNTAARMDVFDNPMPASRSPLKRQWSDSNAYSNMLPRDPGTSESPAKMCKYCDVNKFRFQCNKDKFTKMVRHSKEFSWGMAQLNKKSNYLYHILLAMLKPKTSNGSEIISISPLLNISADKEKAIVQQLNNYMTTNKRLSMISESQKSLGSKMSSLLAKRILSSGDPTLSPDAL